VSGIERLDRFGIWHAIGCPATSVDIRPSLVRPDLPYARCLDCQSLSMLPDDEEVETS